jgi:hypothetical protein
MFVIDLLFPWETAVAKWFLWESFFNVFCLHAACVMRHCWQGAVPGVCRRLCSWFKSLRSGLGPCLLVGWTVVSKS